MIRLRLGIEVQFDEHKLLIVYGKELFPELMRGDIRVRPFDLNGCWVPFYNWHKLLNGLRDAERYCGTRGATDVATGLGAYVERVLAALDDAQLQKVLDCEHGGINESFADLYERTGDRRWLALAERFYHRAVLEPLVIMLTPFGPHTAEELWHHLGHSSSVCDASWPVLDESHLKSDTYVFPIQINGKLRATIELPTDVSAADAEAAADLDEAVRLAEAVFGVNADFFIQRLLPSVTQAAARIGQALESPTTGAMPSSA